MTEQKKTLIGGKTKAPIGRGTISDEIAGQVRQVSDLIGDIDPDPIIQLALARVATRTFAQDMLEAYPENCAALADEMIQVAAAMRGEDPLPDEITRALKTKQETEAPTTRSPAQTGDIKNAEDRESVSEPRGGEQADPEGRDAGRTRRIGARNHGAKRVGKEYAILRVGGS